MRSMQDHCILSSGDNRFQIVIIFGCTSRHFFPLTILRTFPKKFRPFVYVRRQTSHWKGTIPGLLVHARSVAIGSNALCLMRIGRFFDVLSETLLTKYCTKAAHVRFGCQLKISCGSAGKKSENLQGTWPLPATRVATGSVELREFAEPLKIVFTSSTLGRSAKLSAAGRAADVTFSCTSSGRSLSRSMSLQLLCLEIDAELSVPVSPSLSILRARRSEPSLRPRKTATALLRPCACCRHGCLRP